MLLSLEDHKGGYIQIKKAYILVGCIVTASFLGGWFAFYFIQAPQMDHVVNSTAFQHGYTSGFADSVREIYYFNSQPENLITADQKIGIATTNGTAVSFFWFDSNTNQTRGLNLKAHEDLGQTRIQGTLYLMTSPVKWPQPIVQAFNITQTQYMILQTNTGQRYLLNPNQ